jgi:hypothetical protein
MTDNHPITLSSELVEQWANTAQHLDGHLAYTKSIALQAARWGADQELEACCMWITREKSVLVAEELGIARRPKPPTLKEQALESVKRFELGQDELSDLACIRRALEALPE